MYFPAAKRRRDRGCLHAQCALFVGDAMTALCSRSEARAPVDMISQVFCQGSAAQLVKNTLIMSEVQGRTAETRADRRLANDDKKPDVGCGHLKCRHMQ